MSKTIISLADNSACTARSGDGIAAKNEMKLLRGLGHNVVDFYKHPSILPHIHTATTEKLCQLFFDSHTGVVDHIISNQPSNYKLALRLAKKFDAIYISRQHINYESLVNTINRLKLSPDHIIIRQPVNQTLESFHAANLSADIVLSTENIATERENQYYCPPPNIREVEKLEKKQIRSKKDTIKIAVSGRLDDPTKGISRIFSVVKRLYKSSINFELNLYGSISAEMESKLIELIGNQFKNHKWVDSRNLYFDQLSENDVFLTLPYYESYGLATQEAIQLGLFTISTSIGLAGTLGSLVNGESPFTAILCNDLSETELAEKINNLLKEFLQNKKKVAHQNKQLNDTLREHINLSPNIHQFVMSGITAKNENP